MLYNFFKKILFLFDPEFSHKLALNSLFYLNKIGLVNLFFTNKSGIDSNRCVFEFNKNGKLIFKNKLGLAAGLDKNAEYLAALSQLGFGFIEVGTVTPRTQVGNSKPRLFRLIKEQAIINRMGFNNHGVDNLINNVKNFRVNNPNNDLVLGINIGKNSDTPLENSVDDYLICMEKAYLYCDYISVNISSPNTVGLRELQKSEYLNGLLDQIKNKQLGLELKYNKYTPIAVKISPDLTAEQLHELCLSIIKFKIDIIIVSNTTIDDDLLYDKNNNKIQGGLSGRPLLLKSNEILQQVVQVFAANQVSNNILIIGVGGISSKEDAQSKLDAGADLVQVYSGLIFHGPNLINEIINFI